MSENVRKPESEKASEYLTVRTDPITIRNRSHLVGTAHSFEGEAIIIMAKDAHTLKSFLDERLSYPKFNPDLFRRMIISEESTATEASQ